MKCGIQASVALTLAGLCGTSYSVTWLEVYRGGNGSNSNSQIQSIDIDSIKKVDGGISYKARNTMWGRDKEESMYVNCAQALRGKSVENMYKAYPGTLGGDELTAICRKADPTALPTSFQRRDPQPPLNVATKRTTWTEEELLRLIEHVHVPIVQARASSNPRCAARGRQFSFGWENYVNSYAKQVAELERSPMPLRLKPEIKLTYSTTYYAMFQGLERDAQRFLKEDCLFEKINGVNY